MKWAFYAYTVSGTVAKPDPKKGHKAGPRLTVGGREFGPKQRRFAQMAYLGEPTAEQLAHQQLVVLDAAKDPWPGSASDFAAVRPPERVKAREDGRPRRGPGEQKHRREIGDWPNDELKQRMALMVARIEDPSGTAKLIAMDRGITDEKELDRIAHRAAAIREGRSTRTGALSIDELRKRHGATGTDGPARQSRIK